MVTYNFRTGLKKFKTKTTAVISGAAFGAAGLLMAAGFAFPALAANNGTDQFGPIAGASTDGGSCGVPWANDTYKLFFTVHNNGNGTFDLTTRYKDGSFATLNGPSPGSCTTANNHGSLVNSGIAGKFQGFNAQTIASSQYTPGAFDPAQCAVPNLCTRTDFINQVFGPLAVQSGNKFNFEYNSSNSTLIDRHWQDKNDGTTGEQFTGDIANL